jgi:hypothetical protein
MADIRGLGMVTFVNVENPTGYHEILSGFKPYVRE